MDIRKMGNDLIQSDYFYSRRMVAKVRFLVLFVKRVFRDFSKRIEWQNPTICFLFLDFMVYIRVMHRQIISPILMIIF